MTEREREAALVRAVAAGDDAALDALMRRYRRPLYAFLVRHVGDSPDADDLFQETWMRVVRSAGRFEADKRFSTWLFQIALNLCRDRGRRRQARPEDPSAAPHEARGASIAADGPPPDPDPEALLASEQTAAGVRAALAQLPEAQREVLLLRFYEDLSEGEVAEAAGIPRGTVKSRLHAAVRKLRALLAEASHE